MTDAEAVDFIWRDSWSPPDRRAPWLWCEEHVREIPHSPKSGRFSSAETPWLREPLEEVANYRTNLISIIAPIQSGKTMWAELGSAWELVNAPAPSAVFHMKDADAEHYNVSRLRPFYEKIKCLKKLFHTDRNRIKKDSAAYLNGATQIFKGAFNIKNLQGHTLKTFWGDETWQWTEGHMTELESRLGAYGSNAQARFYSQAGETGDDTHRKFLTTDQREWCYKCPSCEEFHPFQWECLQWSEEAKKETDKYDFNIIRETTKYHCRCGHIFDDSNVNRKRMSAAGKFIAQNHEAAAGNVGFHWNSLCCTSWGLLAELYLRAKVLSRKAERGELRKFWQKRLAISWDDNLEVFEADITPSNYDPKEQWEGEGIIHRTGVIMNRAEPVNEEDFEGDQEALADAKKEYDDIMRASKRLLIMCVDVQQTHFWLNIRAWGADGSSRLLEWRGGNKGKKAVHLWEDIEAIRKKYGIRPSLVFIDNGYSTSEVNMKCAEFGYTALQGSARHGFNHRVTKKNKAGAKRRVNVERYYSPVRRVMFSKKLIARVHYWSNLHIKDTLARLRNNQDPSEGATWEIFEGVGATYLKQMDAETRIIKSGKPIWSLIGKRDNHLLDCEAMQVVAATILKLIGKDVEIAQDETEEEDVDEHRAAD